MSHDYSRISQHLELWIQIFKDFHLVFQWVSKRIDVMQYIQVMTGGLELWIINELEKSLFQIQIA